MKKVNLFRGEMPIIGLRVIKTLIAVITSALIMEYVLLQSPFFACVGSVVAMERTVAKSIKVTLIRNIGTIIGGVIGVIIASFTTNIFLMALGLVPFIMISNALGRRESIVSGSVVYFAIFFLNTTDIAWMYGLNRLIGTLIGTLIALIVNALIFPPESPEAHADASDKEEIPTNK